MDRCVKCAQEIYPGELACDGMCPDCFREHVLDLLKTSPGLLAEALGMEVEKR